jgi:glycogen(starch) synthase
MRLWLCPSAFAPHRGGVEELTLKLAQQLLVRDHDVLVVTNRHPADLPRSAQVEGVEVLRLPFSLPGRRPSGILRHVLAAPSLRSQLADLPHPDLLHLICMSSQTGALHAFAQRRRLPFVLTTQGETAMDAHRIYEKSPWLRRDLRRAAADAKGLTACSEWARQHAAGVAKPFASSTVILNGVDPGDWVVPPPPTEPVFAAWGRHVPEKGFDLLITAFQHVRAEVPAAKLLLGGDGPERVRLDEIEGVDFLGSLDREGVRRLLMRARVVVVPSRIEPFGIVALEALAAGRGLVYSSHGGLAEAAGGCGRVADPFDAMALASAMLAELSDPTPALVGQRRAEQLDWSKVAEAYAAVYESALA